ncbi:protein obstructor-E-like [Pieris napi]|uniref:protein obstructor-E-like n=1 Tax=Pieris napi TaxID=78633 RepID=UPI001FB9B028|nr:protein obstructor-E-like [Pieris napi]
MRVFILVALCAVAYGQMLSDDSLNTQEDEFAIEETGGIEENGFSLREQSDVGVASQDNAAALQETSDTGSASQDNVANIEESVDANSQSVNLKETSDFSDGGNEASLTETGDVDDASELNDDGGISKVTESSDIAGESSKYQAQDQYEAQSAPRALSRKTCIEKNERYSIPGSCDRYIECLNGTAEEKLCPDGLRYNPNVKFNVYPCQYPNDVPCLARSSLQPPQATADCPHQFGYFKSGDSKNCGTFKNCVNGVGYDFNCPEGLAFSSETYRCDWPDLVPECDVEAFLGFRCPEVRVSEELGPPAGFRFYRSAEDCQKYFICIDGKPRRLSCGGYNAFDELTESCVAADEISACPSELRTQAERSRKAESQRLIAENAISGFRKALEEVTTFAPYDDIRSENLRGEDEQIIDNNAEEEQPEI